MPQTPCLTRRQLDFINGQIRSIPLLRHLFAVISLLCASSCSCINGYRTPWHSPRPENIVTLTAASGSSLHRWVEEANARNDREFILANISGPGFECTEASTITCVYQKLDALEYWQGCELHETFVAIATYTFVLDSSDGRHRVSFQFCRTVELGPSYGKSQKLRQSLTASAKRGCSVPQ